MQAQPAVEAWSSKTPNLEKATADESCREVKPTTYGEKENPGDDNEVSDSDSSEDLNYTKDPLYDDTIDAANEQWFISAFTSQIAEELDGEVAPPERRIDVTDGKPYTSDEFRAYYGGLAEWEAAPRYDEEKQSTADSTGQAKDQRKQQRKKIERFLYDLKVIFLKMRTFMTVKLSASFYLVELVQTTIYTHSGKNHSRIT